jgi:hypothetical protein
MINNTIIYLFLFIIMIMIVVNHLKCKSNIETFSQSKEDIEKSVKTLIDKIKDKRRNLKNIKTSTKKNKKVEYVNNLIKKLNDERSKINNRINSHKQNSIEKIKQIKKLILYLNNIIKENTLELDKDVNSIKSLYDGLKISIKKTGKKNKYLINLTDSEKRLTNSCLTVKSDGNITTELCNLEDKKQYFEMKNILNAAMYKDNIDQSLYNPYSGNDIEYPFTMVKSFHNDNCVKNENGEISVIPCVIKKSQRWKTFKDEINCSN